MKQRNIVWFRQDLRLSDNPALVAGCANSAEIILVYVLDPKECIGNASKEWLWKALAEIPGLNIYNGDSVEIIERIAKTHEVNNVYVNQCYEPWRRKVDSDLKERLSQVGISYHMYNGSLLWTPDTILKADGKPYQIYTPFYKQCLNHEVRQIMPTIVPRGHDIAGAQVLNSVTLPDAIHLDTIQATTEQKLHDFLSTGLYNYKEGRNFPTYPNFSQLSPYLHFGQISPVQIWHAAKDYGSGKVNAFNGTHIPEVDLNHFLSQLGWREFSYYLLWHFPHLPHENLQPKFNQFPWIDDQSLLRSWQMGNTGYPIVDAGMRELMQTHYMHNRVRMITASFLVKNLMIHWHYGRDWFWDQLYDADLANNSASWQWVAGCGTDAAPYYRIFNPVVQAKKFDPDGEYIKKYVPELSKLPVEFLAAPWLAPPEILVESDVILGKNYPTPIVDFNESRERALAGYRSLKGE